MRRWKKEQDRPQECERSCIHRRDGSPMAILKGWAAGDQISG